MTKRFKITVEYDGSGYVGWQAQENGKSVQDTIEQAIFAFSAERLRLQAAGRTDAGVHALGQIAHFDLKKEISADKVTAAINAYLHREGIAILKTEEVEKDFEARFSAKKRHYLYRILNRRGPPSILRGKVWWVPKKLDVEKMINAAEVFVGNHDFTTFRSINCQAKSPIKTLEEFSVEQKGDEIHITTSARSFLHHQVRSMVGSLKLVGEGRWTKNELKAALEAKNRKAVGFNAPAEGLYLTRVDY